MKDEVIKIGGTILYTNMLLTLVHQALQTGNTEIDLQINWDSDGDWEWVAYALVDISCRRIYAFKIILQEGSKVPVKRFGCMGYVLCPDYGEIVPNMTRPISYATEIAKLPPLESYSMPDYPQDDTVDDFTPSVPPPIAEVPGLPIPTTASFGLNDIRSELSLINANLIRIATVLEKMAGSMPLNGNASR